MEIPRQNLVTDAIVLNAGEIFSSLFRVNHIELWKAQSDSVHDNLDVFSSIFPDSEIGNKGEGVSPQVHISGSKRNA